ncbi:MAG: hypothetical protein HS100_10940 [Anaerolineales bacterium]|nr:hypothetical protein [Anaerolineales bacterium]
MKKYINISHWLAAVFRVCIVAVLVAVTFIYTIPVKAAAGAGTYDNTDGNWTYTGTWTASTGVAGAYNNTFIYSGTTGNTATFMFSGTQFIFTYTQNTNRGNIEVRVDGNLVTTINANGALQFQKTYTSPTFASGMHTVEFRNAGGPGIYIDIDAIQILDGAAPGAGTYDNTDGNWTYTGTWTASTGVAGAYNNTFIYSGTTGNTATFMFSGTQFIFTYTQNTNRGNIEVRVDGNLVTTINANGALQFQKTYTSPTFASGTHTVEFRNAGGPGIYIDIDAIQILSGALPGTPGVGTYDDSDSNWTYTGTWTASTGVAGAYNNTFRYTGTTGDKATFTFNGTQFILTYTQNTNRGNIEVRVDGNLVTTINANGALLFQRTYTSPTYASGTHTVEFRNAGGPGIYIDIDAIQVLDAGGTGEPDLTVNKSHSGSGVEQGETGKIFTITVTNSGDAPTTGTVTVVDSLPAKLTATAMSGSGWSCTLGTLTCTRNDSLDGFLSYPDITLMVNVGNPIVANSLTNEVTVSGGGETNTANNTDSDEVTVLKPDLVILGYELRNAANDAVITTPLPDEAFHIRMTVKNQGTAPTGLFYPGVFLDDQPNYGPDTEPFGRVSDWTGYRRTPNDEDSVSGIGCNYYDPTDSINPLTTAVDTERGNYTRSSFNSSLDPGAQANVDVYIGYPDSEPEYSDPAYDPYRTGLPEGSYTVYLYVDPNCSGGAMESNEENAFDPINITVSNTSSAPGAGTYDDSDSNWAYTGTWTASTGVAGAYNNTFRYTGTSGDKATFMFSGTQFILKYTQNTNRGNIEVRVDGNLVTTINANGALQFQKTYTSPTFASGTHTVEFRNAGGPGIYIDIDAIQILSSAAPGAGTYDDSDSNWTYTGTWTASTGVAGAYNNTFRYTGTTGDKATFTFNGTQFILKYTQNTNRGNIEVRVDGNLVTTINANGVLQFQKTYTSPTFASGTHTVEFRNAGGPGIYIDIDAIQILSGVAPGAGTYDDSDSNWAYTGTWTASTGVAGAYNNTFRYTGTSGDKATFMFSGTQFILKYTQNTNRGNIEVRVDGNLVTTINANGALQFQKTYTSPTFASGTHTVEFRNAGGPGIYIDIDAIQILSAPVAGTYDDSDSNWTYTGTWTASTGVAGAYNNTFRYTGTTGDKATFTFNGTQFILKYTQNTNRGNIEVRVDGNLVTTINANGVLQFQKTYTSPTFASGTHTVEFRNAGGPGIYIDIDAIQIQ